MTSLIYVPCQSSISMIQRYGPFTEWMSFIDTDEYLVPMKKTSWQDVLDDMEAKDVQVLKMRSSRGLPRHYLME